ncbi:unnamed protein product [Arctogadus glacialis]
METLVRVRANPLQPINTFCRAARTPHYPTVYPQIGPQDASLSDRVPPDRTTERLTIRPCTPRSDHRTPHYQTVYPQIGPQDASLSDRVPPDRTTGYADSPPSRT